MINSGDIYKIVPLILVLAKVFLFYLDSPKSDNFNIYLYFILNIILKIIIYFIIIIYYILKK